MLTVLTGLAGVAAMALLLAFGQVVRTGVNQAGARRAAAAIQADAAWRCQVALGQGLRTACQPAGSAAPDQASAVLPDAGAGADADADADADAQMLARVSPAR
jgi:hypothetical protein